MRHPFAQGPRLAALAFSFLSALCPAAAEPAEPAWNVAQAYQAVFGRVPDREGLAYWSAQPAARTLAGMVDALRAYAPAPAIEVVQQAYAWLLGRNLADYPEGIRHWACRMPWDGSQAQAEAASDATQASFCAAFGTFTPGQLVETLVAILEQHGEPVYLQRKRLLQAAMRQQLGGSQAEGAPAIERQLDLQSLLRRVTQAPRTLDESLEDLARLATPGAPRPPAGWRGSVTAASMRDQARDMGRGVRSARGLSWVTKDGEMMLAHAYLPPGYPAGPARPVVVTLHAGGWKEGSPDNIGRINLALAAAGYLVLSPTYRLAPAARSPQPQQDVAQFIALVRDSVRHLNADASRVHLFGYSAGGHLAALVGTATSVGCVATYGAPLDLAAGNFPPGLAQDIASYAGPTPLQEVSPTAQLARGTATRFLVMYGVGDGLVPASQPLGFAVAAPQRVVLAPFAAQHLIPDTLMPHLAQRMVRFFDSC